LSKFSTFLEGELKEFIFRTKTIPFTTRNRYVALYTSDPTDDNTGDEYSLVDGYNRHSIEFSTAVYGQTSNTNVITFQQVASPTNPGGTFITHVAIFDDVTGGNMLYHSPLSIGKNLSDDDIVFNVDQIKIEVG
jgi:hypothetical protein